MSKATLTIAREALLPALGAVTRVIEKRSTIPIMSNVRFVVDGARLTLTGSDLDAEIAVDVECRFAGKAAFTLPAATLHDAVRKLPDGCEVAIEADEKNSRLSAGRSRFFLPVLPAGDFPTMQAEDFSHAFTLDAAVLSRMLASVFFAISTEETRYYLNGIHWHADDRHLNAVATDGHRLAKFPLALPDGAAGMPAIIIPRKTIGLVKTMVGEKGTVAIGVSERKVRFAQGSATLVSKLIDGTFPDYQRVVPAGNPNRFTVVRDELVKAVDRVTTISSERGSAVKFTFAQESALKLATINPDAGSAEDEVPVADAGGDDVEIGFNGRYCLDMLNACDADRVTFCLGDPGSPALIEPVGAADPAPFFVLMPMRV